MKMPHLIAAGVLLTFGCSEKTPSGRLWDTPDTITEEELVEKIVSVDHFQFYLRDASITRTEGIVTDFPQIGPVFGAEATGQDQFFLISTIKETGDIRVRLAISTVPPTITDYQFVGCLRFRITSGAVAVDGYYNEEAIKVVLSNGDYSCYICSANGMDYDLVLVPSKARKFGTLTP